MHFQKRVKTHVLRAHRLDDAAYAAMSKEARKQRRLQLLQAAADVCRIHGEAYTAPPDD